MYFVEIELKSGNWVTVKGCKTFEDAEQYVGLYCNNNNYNIYEK